MPSEIDGRPARYRAPCRARVDRVPGADGRRLHLEVEPGTYLVANAGAVVATCIDVVDTGADGYQFAKLDTGMTEVTRPALYGAQHPITVISRAASETAEHRLRRARAASPATS